MNYSERNGSTKYAPDHAYLLGEYLKTQKRADQLADQLEKLHGHDVLGESDDSEDAESLLANLNVEMPLTSAELSEADVSCNYLIDGILAEGRPQVIAGPYKSLKTSVAIDMAISLAAGRKFLGEFWVERNCRVLNYSAESGKSSVKETAIRVCQSKDVDFASLPIHWGFWVPKANDKRQMRLFEKLLEEIRPDVVILDPLYLALSGEIQANLSLAGDQIARLTQTCVDMGCTPVCLDHVKRGSENARRYEPLELGDVTGSGKAEFFRQWLLLGRRSKFDAERPNHELWMTVGGNDGHCGSFALDVDENRDLEGQRMWDVTIRKASETRVDDAERREEAKERAAEAKRQRTIHTNSEKLYQAYMSVYPDAITKRKSRELTGLSNDNANVARAALLRNNRIEEVELIVSNQKCEGHRCTNQAS